ncbi:MAG: UDP-N-acetylmuramoyl-tripeptide--D-alanyl-D-alanine ligase [Patescibacteria group bacterium]
MFFIIFIIGTLGIVLPLVWIVREIKAINFWLYVWQLKEYHPGRFADYFRTAKGKEAIFNKLLYIKILLLVLSLGFSFFADLLFSQEDLAWELQDSIFYYGTTILFVAIFLVYLLQAARVVSDSIQKKLILPAATKKIVLLRIVIVAVTILFLAAPILIASLGRFEFLVNLGVGSIQGFLLFDIFTPLIVSVVVLGFQPIAVLGRNRIIQKAKRKRAKMKNLKVVGITGSYGKTTTKEILAHVLSQRFKVVKTPEHKNSEVGISQVVLNSLTDVHDIFVCEMGAYNKGGIKLLADIVKPHIGIVTGVNEQHLATFGSMENLLSAEGGKELVESLPKDGVVILNGNSRYCRDLYEKIEKPRKILCNTFGAIAPNVLMPKADIWAEDVRIAKENISFNVEIEDGEKADFKVNLIGSHNVENILLAVAAAKELGMSLQEIAKACESITQEMGAMKLRKAIGGLNIIDSTYSANPDGVIAALEYLKVWKGRKAIVMPCLIELGKASKEVHYRIGEKIGEVCDVAIITTKDWFDELKQGAMGKGMEEGQILFQEDPQKIFDMIKNINQQSDVLLLESRVPLPLLESLKLNSYVTSY